ncbi:MAG: 50S ribosomal protein L18Ae [Candidatus Kariarchaeaceae archaeon]|jgi:large subunit ribosomal protein LX
MEYKIYRATGHFVKNKRRIPLQIECRASKVEDVLEKVYSEIGSRHRVKREEIFIAKKGGIVEISLEEASKLVFSDVDKDDFKIDVGRHH